MFSQDDIPVYLAQALPEMKTDLEDASAKPAIFKLIQCLAGYTKNKVMEHDLKTAKKCFGIAENMYSKGNEIIKKAIENEFVCSLPALFSKCSGRKEKRNLHGMIPLCLYTAYVTSQKKRIYR